LSKSSKIEILSQDRRFIFGLFAVEVVALALMRLPASLNFFGFAPFDAGNNLTAEYFVRHGYRAAIDFSYPYGLLGLLAGHVWFNLAGLTPWSYEVANWLMSLFIVWGLVRVVVALRAGLAGVLLFALTMPILVFTQYLTFSHALEAAFIIHALAAQAARNRSQALVWATLAVLAKPAMGLFYGLFLIGFVVLDMYRADELGWGSFVKVLAPASAVAVSGSLILAGVFGIRSLAATILPFSASREYGALHFGFMHAGESFWWPQQRISLGYYVQSVAGFYVLATLLLLAGALWACAFRIRSNLEVLVTCALLQVVFIAILWGNQFSWVYYSYLPVIGLAAALRMDRIWKYAILACALLMPAAKFTRLLIVHLEPATAVSGGGQHDGVTANLQAISQSSLSLSAWFDSKREPAMAGLWATPDQRAQWLKVLALVRGKPAAILETDGCVPLFYPAVFMPPVSLFLIAGLTLPSEVSRTLDQVNRADTLVFPTGLRLLRELPQLGARVNADFQPIFRGNDVIVFGRKSAMVPSGEPKSAPGTGHSAPIANGQKPGRYWLGSQAAS